MKIGRRPVYILGTILNLVGCIAGGVQYTVEVYYVVNILTGFGAAPVDSLVQISTTDIFFAHERGTRLSIFALALGTGSYMGPVAAGYITESQSWRWYVQYLSLFGTFSRNREIETCFWCDEYRTPQLQRQHSAPKYTS